MKTWQTVLLSAAVAAVAAFGVTSLNKPGGGGTAGAANGAYQHVVDAKTIRCGYVIYPPGLIKEPNSGKIEGIFPETLEAAAADLGYKVEWTEEVGWATMIEGLKAGRYDALCSPTWANATRAQFAEFTVPLFYSGIGVYVRADDHRFDTNLSALNDPGVSLATIDGEMTSIVSSQDYPRAKTVALPQNTDVSQVLLNVVDRKADATFVEPYIAEQFLKSHPGALRNLTPDRPVRIFPNTMLVAKGNYQLKGLLDTMLAEVNNSGRTSRLIAKYDTGGTFYTLAQPYGPPVRAATK